MHISLLRPRTACTRTYVTVVITYTEARSFRQINNKIRTNRDTMKLDEYQNSFRYARQSIEEILI